MAASFLLALPAGAAAQADAPAEYRLGLALHAGQTPGRGFAEEPGDFGSEVWVQAVRLSLETPRGWLFHLSRGQVSFWAPRTLCNANGCGPAATGYGGVANTAGVDRLILGPGARFTPYVGARAGTFRRTSRTHGRYDPVWIGDVHVGLQLRLGRWLIPRFEAQRHSHSPLLLAGGLRVSIPIEPPE